MKTFKNVFPTVEIFRKRIENGMKLSKESEIVSENNWIWSQEDLYTIAYLIFTAKTNGKYFIWEDENIDDMIDGMFVQQFFHNLINFYKTQLFLIGNDLNELKDYRKRGSESNTHSDGVESTKSQTTSGDKKWNDGRDIPSGKFDRESNLNTTNRMRDIWKLVNTNINIFVENLFTGFELFFINKFWLE